jgi:hypothetical protein
MACQAPTAATARLVCELKAKGEEKGEHKLQERLAIIQQANVGGFIPEINGCVPPFTHLVTQRVEGLSL